jgi:uncharacterized membrane protein
MRRLRHSVNAAELLSVAAVAVGAAAALETAIVPGVIIGAVAMLAPRQLTRLRPRGPRRAAAPTTKDSLSAPSGAFTGRHLGRAAVKTITFRVISTSLDFGWNYFLLGELATAAGLSAFSLAAAPVFYFLHEAAWSRLRQI